MTASQEEIAEKQIKKKEKKRKENHSHTASLKGGEGRTFSGKGFKTLLCSEGHSKMKKGDDWKG